MMPGFVPGRRLLYLGLALALAACAQPWLPPGPWWLVPLALVSVAVIDAALGWRIPPLTCERRVSKVWARGRWGEVTLTVHHPQGRALRLALFDHYPTGWEMQGLPHAASRLAAGRFLQLGYRLLPTERGDHRFGRLELRVETPLRLWARRAWVGEGDAVRVFPDFTTVLKRSLAAADRRVPQAGVLRRRRRGEGTDFHQLREYRRGDSLRAIDWKATARQQKPISREYQEERDQQIVFMLDCGRRMHALDGETSHFDHALNAMLVLAWLAQKQGDAVGLFTFAGPQRWLAPTKGRAAFDRLLAGLYDLEPGEIHPDYVQAAQALGEQVRKRSLIVLLTNVRDEDSDALPDALRLLTRHHRVMCVSLREVVLDQVLAQPATDLDSALLHCGTLEYVEARRQALLKLHGHARELMDVTPQQLPLALVNRYLDLKESGAL
ncbi:DUF58 domain-containing protein [Chitiniphilus eburneus]|uniref:DUF58 domain-containing protein n=1 Tax=Chitiniphilus eburneus TaxID=2571148 RepID=A0A4U0QEK4_9NEIS|nr:DUF58 domain-containing protein [Chitiniphilus eburneus]TJZ79092.1 DUF58 domain-containing protein [Chitiniphilus eburneus]